jgi:hypothetical protein
MRDKDQSCARQLRVRALRYALLAVLTACLTAIPVSAQDTVRYEDGKLLANFLPHHKVFRVTGSRVVNGVKASIVKVTVTRPADSVRINKWPFTWGKLTVETIVDTGCYIAPANSTTDDFSIAIRSLALGANHNFTFQFYSPAPQISINDPLEATINDAVALPAFESRQLDSIASGHLRAMVTKLESQGNRVVYMKKDAQSPCGISESTAPPVLGLTTEQRNRVRAAVIALKLRSANLNNYDKARRDQEGLPGRLGSLTRTLRAEKQNDLKLAADKRVLAYDLADVDALEAFFLSTDTLGSPSLTLSADIQARLNDAATYGVLSTSDDATLEGLLNVATAISTANMNYRANAAAALLPADIKAEMKDGFFDLAQATVKLAPWAAEAEVRKIQIGTAFGGGFAMLDAGDGEDEDGFAFLILKLYWDAVDKSLPDPWSTSRARWAWNIGAVSGSALTYHGQTQLDAIGGLKPMMGVSFDAQRRIAIHVGGVLFRQPSINPLGATERKRLRVAPFLGIAFDFDALNELKTLIGKTP